MQWGRRYFVAWRGIRCHANAAVLAEPLHWREHWRLISRARRRRTAPVDLMGCDRLADRDAPPAAFRLETLVAGILSAQTKDGANAAAVARLQARCKLPGCSAALERQLQPN